MSKSKELQNRIAQLRKEIADLMKNQRTHTHTPIEIASRHSEIFVAATQLAEITTRRIVWLTVALLVLTGALLAYTIFLYNDTHENIQHRALTEHYELQIPKPRTQTIANL